MARRAASSSGFEGEEDEDEDEDDEEEGEAWESLFVEFAGDEGLDLGEGFFAVGALGGDAEL